MFDRFDRSRRPVKVWYAAASIAGDPLDLDELTTVTAAALDAVAAVGGTVDHIGIVPSPVTGVVLVWIVYRAPRGRRRPRFRRRARPPPPDRANHPTQ